MLAEIPIAQLRVFLHVLDAKSYRVAADKVLRSQPAVSKIIQLLEEKLGAPLFEADRRTTPTAFGKVCEPLARELVKHHDRIVETLLSQSRQHAGTLTLASIGSFATNWVPALIKDFIGRHPGAAVRLIDDNSENIHRMVLSGEVDFGLSSEISITPGLDFIPLMTDAFGLVCHASHPLARRGRLEWSVLADLPLIGTTAHRELNGTPEAKWLDHCWFHVSNMMTLSAMLSSQVGVTILPRLAVPAFAKDLRFVPLVRPGRHRRIGIVKVKSQTLPPLAQAMEQELMAYAALHGNVRPKAARRR
ncbi:LysR family transcriptional regulator [Pigmentiphaga kullae]|uniref:LysR family transcriptional regulator n=1 Tax=Pigmentiphaga kullae TaxID=151784 RepID=A0A4Q7NJ86_9BURK|nr:LysR family transcriptional regulator [Pigmentiphaga kullae]RZS85121.1 LysR family transcriptional regulator [Pigmentiphaga kullae]